MTDIGHRDTDKLLREMEKKISGVYSQASKEVEEKLNDYTRRFKIKDEKWRAMVASGQKTAEEYRKWRTGQLIMTKRWEEMRDTLAADLHNANVLSRSIIAGYMPEVYALNHNYATFLVEKGAGVDTSYSLYSRETVERLVQDDPQLLKMPGQRMKQTFADFDAYKNGANVDDLPEETRRAFDKLIAEGKDVRWQEGQIQSVMLQGILQGESIPNITKRIGREMGDINHKATIRYARTATTAAQNAGRLDAYKRGKDMGINMKQTWIATLDSRTRHDHRVLDGQTVEVDEPFEVDGYKIRYPGDPSAPGFLIWNCRCTTITQIKGFERDVSDLGLRRDSNLEEETYEEWVSSKRIISHPITKQEDIGEGMKWKTINEFYRRRRRK